MFKEGVNCKSGESGSVETFVFVVSLLFVGSLVFVGSLGFVGSLVFGGSLGFVGPFAVAMVVVVGLVFRQFDIFVNGYGFAHSGIKSCPDAKIGKRCSLASMAYVSILEKTSSQLRS